MLELVMKRVRTGPGTRAMQKDELRHSGLLERHHAHPEHNFAADIDVVLAHEGELAVISDAKHGKAGSYSANLVAFAHVHRQVVLHYHHAPTRIDVKRARMDTTRFDVLNGIRLAGRRVDRVNDDAVFAAFENL